MLERHASVTVTVCSSAARTAFSAWFREQFLAWQGEPVMTSSDGWLRQQVVAMAAEAGDASLVAPLRQFLDARYRVGGGYGVPAAASAVNALARLTGIELRYEADGTRGRSTSSPATTSAHSPTIRNRRGDQYLGIAKASNGPSFVPRTRHVFRCP